MLPKRSPQMFWSSRRFQLSNTVTLTRTAIKQQFYANQSVSVKNVTFVANISVHFSTEAHIFQTLCIFVFC